MKILVIGGAGFIGSHICDALLENDHTLRVYGRKLEQFRPPLPGVEYVIQDFNDGFALSKALNGIDCVVHTLSSTVPGNSNLDPLGDITSNLSSSVYLLELMRKVGPRKIIFLSSGGTIYGDPATVPVNEEHPLKPICSYGVVKAAIEHYLAMYQQLYGIEATILRAANPYGPRQGGLGTQGLITALLNRIKSGHHLEIWGNGEIVRDYFEVSDLASICAKAVDSSVTGIFNVGSGTGTSINQIIREIALVTGIDPVVRYAPARNFDVQKIWLDISRAKESFGWTPEIGLPQGIGRTWDWLNRVN